MRKLNNTILSRIAISLLTVVFCTACGSSASDGLGGYGRVNSNAPVLAAIGARSVVVGETLQFTLSATDNNDDAITFTAEGTGISGATDPFLTDPPATLDETTGEFSWTPFEAGFYTVEFIATDDSVDALFDSETVTITVQNASQ